jgi:hypothetical protein
MGKVYFVKEPGGDSCVIMDEKLLRDEKELREPLEGLGMEFHVYHDWALTQSKGFFTVAKSKAEFLTAAFDLHYGKTVKKEIDRIKTADQGKRSGEPLTEDCAHCPQSKECVLSAETCRTGTAPAPMPTETTAAAAPGKINAAVTPEDVRKRLEEIRRKAAESGKQN